MSEETDSPGVAVVTDQVPHIPQTFPPSEFVTIFAEVAGGVLSGGGLVRAYFARTDGEVFGRPVKPPHLSPVGQLIMPAMGFAGTALFFESRLKYMIASGEVDAGEVEKLRQAFPNLKSGA